MLHIREMEPGKAEGATAMRAAAEDVRTTLLPNGYALHSYATRAAVPMAAGARLLNAHVTLMHQRMVASGGPDFNAETHSASFWEAFDTVLPPKGRYYLATAPDGSFVGTGALRGLTADVGEMKHLYVAPEARRAGLGKALVDARMADAREMGLKTLLADTFAANTEMPALYDRLGFERVPPFEDSATAQYSPELVRHMLFFRYDLTTG